MQLKRPARTANDGGTFCHCAGYDGGRGGLKADVVEEQGRLLVFDAPRERVRAVQLLAVSKGKAEACRNPRANHKVDGILGVGCNHVVLAHRASLELGKANLHQYDEWRRRQNPRRVRWSWCVHIVEGRHAATPARNATATSVSSRSRRRTRAMAALRCTFRCRLPRAAQRLLI